MVNEFAYQPFGFDKLYKYILQCSSHHSPKNFAMEAIAGIRSLCDYDSALVYFLDGSGNLQDQYLLNVDNYWNDLYLDYYASSDGNSYTYKRHGYESPENPTPHVRNWMQEASSEFISDYITPRGLYYSLGFMLYDLNGCGRVIMSLDRKTKKQFSNDELLSVGFAVPLLNNIFKNFFYQQNNPRQTDSDKQALWKQAKLTNREAQIANMLCDGASPAQIASALCITVSTTYKHIAHIYEKMNVSSKQELLVKLLG